MHLTNEITMGMVINWVITLGVGVVVFGLLKYTFNREKELLLSKVEHSRNGHMGLLTEVEHDNNCKETVKELISSRKAEIKEAMEIQGKILDEKFIVLNKNIELAVMKGLQSVRHGE